jgi:microcompartment protein CcmK/EutM
VERVIGADREEWVPVVTGLSVRQFHRQRPAALFTGDA